MRKKTVYYTTAGEAFPNKKNDGMIRDPKEFQSKRLGSPAPAQRNHE